MYCKHCGSRIDDDCIVCPKCGKQVGKLKIDMPENIYINANASSVATNTRHKKKYSLLLDIILTILTCGLWLIVCALRPKYE